MIKKYSLKALQQAINYALSLDELSKDRIDAMHGKVIEIIVKPLDINFYIQCIDKELKLLDSYEKSPDTVIQSYPLGLIRLSFLPASKARSLFNDSIQISGDVELGQDIKALFDELDIDWEGHLAQLTGDVVAHQIGSMFKQGVAFHREITSTFHHNVTAFFQEEVRLLPPREELDDFFQDIDTLAMDVERLEALINLLMATYENP